MKKLSFLAILTFALVLTSAAFGSNQANGAWFNGIWQNGVWSNGISPNAAASGAMSIDGVQLVDGQLVRR